MNDNLKRCQDVLINLSLNNKTLYLDSIDDNEFFDLYNLKNYDENIYSNLIDFIFSKQNELKIVEDLLFWQSNRINEIHTDVTREKEFKIKNFVPNTNFSDIDSYKKFLDNFYRDNIIKRLDSLNHEYFNMNCVISNLTKLCGETKKRSLYLGYPFIEGYINEGNFIRMPLLLIPIDIFVKDNAWFMKKRITEKVKLNKYLLILMNRIFGYDKGDLKTEYDFENEFERNVVEQLIDILKNVGIRLYDESSISSKKFNKFLDVVDKLKSDKNYLNVRNYLVLGDFSTIIDEFEDYNELINMDLSNSLVDKFINKQKDKKEVFYDDLFNFMYIKDNLDFDQKNSIYLADSRDITLINSPINTRKDVTIFNFILDKIGKNQKVLVVSRNRDWLKNLYDKFSDMKFIIMDMFKSNFYEKFYKNFNKLNRLNIDDSINNKFDEISAEISKYYNFIYDSNEIYNQIGVYGLSLNQMYELTIDIKEKKLNSISFEKFSLNNPVSGCSFDEIICAIDEIKSNNLIDVFLNHKEYLSKYKVINSVREDIGPNNVQDYIDKLKDFINKYEKISLDIDRNECSLKIIELIRENNLSKETILTEARRFYPNYDESKFDDSKENRFKGFSFLRGSKNKRDHLENSRMDNSLIYYNRVELLNDEISFLRDILKSDVFNMVRDKLFNFEDITEYIENILNMMYSFGEFITQSSKTNNFSPIVRDILEYIYDDSISEEMMYSNLEDILKFSALINITRNHKKHESHLMDYKLIDDCFDKLSQLFKMRCDIVEKFIFNSNVSLAKRNLINNGVEELIKSALFNIEDYSIKEFVRKFYKECLELFPCFFVEYSSISNTLPLVDGMFDYILIEDGNDYFVEEIIPCIFRAKKLVVFGDNNQVTSESKEYKIFMKEDTDISYNLFNFIDNDYETVNVKYTYCSRNRILDDISNLIFNNNRIISIPDNSRYIDIKNPFEIFKLDLDKNKSIVTVESEFVIELLFNMLRKKEYDQSILIVTLTQNHAELISELLNEKLKVDEEFNYLYNRHKNTSGIDITSIRNVSYSTKNILILALGGGIDINGNIDIRFNEISDVSYVNKLWIFSQIPSDKVNIVSSFDISDLNYKNEENKNIRILKEYFYYASKIYNGKITEAMKELDTPRNIGTKQNQIIDIIYKALLNRGLNVERNYGVKFYKFDLAIYDNDLKEYVLFVEFEDSLISKFDNEIERYVDCFVYFNELGYNVLKIWSKDLWDNLNTQVENIVYNYFILREKLLKKSPNLSVCNSEVDIEKKSLIGKFVGILNNKCIDGCKN